MPVALQSRPEYSGILRQDESFAVPDNNSLGNRFNGWFDRLMVQSGGWTSPALLLALCACSAVALGGVLFVWQENLLTTGLGAFIGFMIPLAGTMLTRARRQKLMSQQLPAMIDELARAAKTGRSLENCLLAVANDTPSPLGQEMRICTRRMALGLNVDEALQELPQRTGLVGTSVLATALSVHRQTGGDLVRVLERLSQTLRDRLQFQGRLQAATAASRASFVLLVALPPAILAFFAFRDPNYLNTLFASPWGARVTIAAFVLEFVGAMWILRILNKSQQV